MKLVTFNVRKDVAADGGNRFLERRESIVQQIHREMPDVIGFQEVEAPAEQWLKEHLPEYEFVGHGRAADLTTEAVPVAFRRERFRLRGMDCFWLSPTPCVPGSRYEGQGVYARICTAVMLFDVRTGQSFHVLNVHLDHVSDAVRQESARQLAEYCRRTEERTEAPVILLGDWNAHPEEEPIRIFQEQSGYSDATKAIPESFHGFGSTSEKIDYIFVSGRVCCKCCRIWKSETGFLSDHHPICLECEWNPESNRTAPVCETKGRNC